jgi:hypothetical protein
MGKYKKKLPDNISQHAKGSQTLLKRKIKKQDTLDLPSKAGASHLKISHNENLKRLTSHNRKKKDTTQKRNESTSDTISPRAKNSTGKITKKERKETTSLRERMMNRLQGARFR